MKSTQAQDRIAFLRGLRATRAFSERPIADSVIADILEVARWSGSAINEQPWHFVVVRNRSTLERIGHASSHAGHVAGARIAIAVVMDNRHPNWEAFDEGRLAERIMLAAHAHEVGSCIGWLEPASASESVKELLFIPADRSLRTMVSLGYPEQSHAPTSGAKAQARKPLHDVVSSERFTGPDKS